MGVRIPAVAGGFYPSQKNDIHKLMAQCFDLATEFECAQNNTDMAFPKALVLPHAGWIYSGPIAAAGYQLLKPLKQKIRRVVLIGPAHRVAFKGIALPSVTAFATPLGEVPIDRTAIEALAQYPFIHIRDDAHAKEHALEVHLPFLQHSIEHFELVPMVVGHTCPSDVAEAIEYLWGGDETLIVISSDLSHFHPYEIAQTMDEKTVHKIMRFETNIEPEQACGCFPLNGFLTLAKNKHMKNRLLSLANSGDTAGDRQQVVGYTSIAFYNS